MFVCVTWTRFDPYSIQQNLFKKGPLDSVWTGIPFAFLNGSKGMFMPTTIGIPYGWRPARFPRLCKLHTVLQVTQWLIRVETGICGKVNLAELRRRTGSAYFNRLSLTDLRTSVESRPVGFKNITRDGYNVARLADRDPFCKRFENR
jgi:hypothetical protein